MEIESSEYLAAGIRRVTVLADRDEFRHLRTIAGITTGEQGDGTWDVVKVDPPRRRWAWLRCLMETMVGFVVTFIGVGLVTLGSGADWGLAGTVRISFGVLFGSMAVAYMTGLIVDRGMRR